MKHFHRQFATDEAIRRARSARRPGWPLAVGPYASGDTHPQGGDAKQAPFMSGAVTKADAQSVSPNKHKDISLKAIAKEGL